MIKQILRPVISFVSPLQQKLQNAKFLDNHQYLKNQRKIIYALTPPPHLKNVGDHAQVVAIRLWLQKHFPELPVIELDKDESQKLLPALKELVQPSDLFFLHSGGNLGDRGIWSESIRRLLISSFPQNQIVSLPQTIHFSDTPTGRIERETTHRIYTAHPNLTVIGRDPQSGELAKELFPKAQTFCTPDFVLSLPPRQSDIKNNPPKILLCLRLDDESALNAQQRKEIGEKLPYDCTYFDTTIASPIKASERNDVLERTLDLFQSVDVVVTDRYHGLIFTILCRKPCVVLPTVDHKLTSAMHWFQEIPFIKFVPNINAIPSLVEQCLSIESREVPDWNQIYFDKIPQTIGIK